MVHIFEVTDDEYFAAATAEEAVECAIREWGQDTYDESSEEFGAPMQLDDDALADKPFNDDGRRVTFRVKLDEMISAGEKFPAYFASGNL